MSTSASIKPIKAGKTSKSSTKSKPNIEIACKFRGKYDLNKKKNNKEISLENAINLFEVIYKKNEDLFKDTNIKMYKDKKMFSFGDKKRLSKVHHRVPYIQVNKFFVLHRDPTMIIMGVHHKSHKWFLVFQFNTVEDLTKFCDEIEGEKKTQAEVKEVIVESEESKILESNVPEIQIEYDDIVDYPNENSNEFEKISIHSEMLNNKEMAVVNFDESYYEPDLNTQTLNEPETLSRCSSRSSNDSDFDTRVHCDDLSQSKLKDLFMKRGSELYLDICDWEEDLTCINYPRDENVIQDGKSGSIYMYCAQVRSKDQKLHSDDLNSLKSIEEKQFNNYVPKMISKKNQESIEFDHFEPKFLDNDFETQNHASKLINSNADNFNHHEPKLLNNDSLSFNHLEPKLLTSESKDFHNHEPKLITKYEDSQNFKHFDPKFIMNEN